MFSTGFFVELRDAPGPYAGGVKIAILGGKTPSRSTQQSAERLVCQRLPLSLEPTYTSARMYN